MLKGIVPSPNILLARRLFYFALALFLLAVIVGAAWDGLWHARNPFDDFFSPPHIFIYVMTSLTALVVIAMVFSDPVRRAFGSGFKIAILPFPVPGSLFLLSAGLGVLGFAGLVLDNLWHTAFGLDETRWSFPHAMLGAGVMLTAFGFVACRLALRQYHPLHWYSTLLLGVLLVFPLASPLGPLAHNHTPETVEAISRIPALAAQESFQHTFRIYQTHNLNRTNPLLIPFGALWAGTALAMIRQLDRRWWMVLLIAFLGAAASGSRGMVEMLDRIRPLMDNPANWQPLPLFLTAGGMLFLMSLGMAEGWAYGAGGIWFGMLVYSNWVGWNVQYGGLLVLLALTVPLVLLGKYIGEWIYSVLEYPVEPVLLMRLILAAGVAIPLVTGIIDLILRASTP